MDKKNIIFDPLAMTVSADKNAALETLGAVKIINEKLGCDTILGISNVSFGLPERDRLNGAYLTMAMTNGLSAAIVNPYSQEIKRAYKSYLALSGNDLNFECYIASATEQKSEVEPITIDLQTAIIKGMKSQAARLATELLGAKAPLDIINLEIIPALNIVGDGFEQKRIYLPGLLMSAEAAGAAFESIKSAMPKGEGLKCPVVLATVKGDIHDIGKNILKLILENYGYEVHDLGKDVSAEKIVDTALNVNAKIVGLSALMTTTLPAMEKTVGLLRKGAPDCKIMVGGAVLNEEYAKEIGADFYGKDAMEAVRYAENVNK